MPGHLLVWRDRIGKIPRLNNTAGFISNPANHSLVSGCPQAENWTRTGST